MKISLKIIISFLLLVLMSFGLMTYISTKAVSLNETAQTTLEKAILEEEHINRINIQLTEYFATLESASTLIDLKILGQKETELNDIMADLKSLVKVDHFSSESAMKSLTVDLGPKLISLETSAQKILSYVKVFAQTQSINIHEEEVIPLKTTLLQSISNTKSKINKNVSDNKASMYEKIQTIVNVKIFSFILLAGTSLTLIAFLWRSTITPITSFTNFLRDFDARKRNVQVPYRERHDEIGNFATAFESMMQARDDAETQLSNQAIDLMNARDQAMAADLAKMEFLANMSHEIRTPLNGIMGMAQLIRQDRLDAQDAKKVNSILKSSNHLLNLVNDILDYSRINARRVQLERIHLNLYEEIQATCIALEPLARQKGLDFIIQIDIPQDKKFIGDPTRIRSILNNLIGNAIRYTNEGHIHVKAETKILSDQKIQLDLNIIDTGIGIEESKQAQVFEKFTQANNATTRKYGGTGLGLSITKELVSLMDGTIGLKSKPGAGSTFSCHIPFEIVTQTHPAEETKKTRQKPKNISLKLHTPRNIKILVVDDSETNSNVMVELFSYLGITDYDLVNNGYAALEKIKEHKYDLILMDCHMQDMDGYETTRRIRNLGNSSPKNTPVIAVTGDVVENNEAKCLAAGMNGFISKPFHLEDIKETLSTYIDFDVTNDTQDRSLHA